MFKSYRNWLEEVFKNVHVHDKVPQSIQEEETFKSTLAETFNPHWKKFFKLPEKGLVRSMPKLPGRSIANLPRERFRKRLGKCIQRFPGSSFHEDS